MIEISQRKKNRRRKSRRQNVLIGSGRTDQLWPQHILGLAVVSSMPVMGTLVVCRV